MSYLPLLWKLRKTRMTQQCYLIQVYELSTPPPPPAGQYPTVRCKNMFYEPCNTTSGQGPTVRFLTN